MPRVKTQESSGTLVVDRVEEPHMYKVILLNDDVTTMEFVVYILETIFAKNHEEAKKIMLAIHQEGSGVCGVYPLEIAEVKQLLVRQKAGAENFPLKCILERE